MSEKLFDPNEPIIDRRRLEKVTLDNGVLWVKEMEVADLLFCQEHSQRAPGGPAYLAVDFSAMQIWQIVVSCYRGPEPEAARTFEISHTNRIKKLRPEEWLKIRQAIENVNGMADEEAAALRDFTAAPPDDSPGTGPSGASAISIDFPANSPSPAPI